MGTDQTISSGIKRGFRRVDDRQVISGIIHVLLTGTPWRAAPKEYGPGRTLYNSFRRWAEKGTREAMFASLADEKFPERVVIDSTIVRAHRSAGGGKGGRKQCIGRSRGGPTTKIHLVTDARGRPLVIAFSPGQTSDIYLARQCLV